MELTITKVGDAEGIVLPKAILDRMHLKAGDTIHLTETPDGIQLSSHESDLSETLEIARQIMREDHDLLKKLAE